MTLITGIFSISANSSSTLTIDRDALAALISDTYFSNKDNWKKVIIKYVGDIQSTFVTFDGQTGLGKCTFPEKVINGSFKINSIKIMDFLNGEISLTYGQVPNVESYSLGATGGISVGPEAPDSSYLTLIGHAQSLGYTLPSPAQQTAHSNMVKALKSSGVWAKLDVFYLFCNNGSKEFATLNWINPSAHQCTIVNSMSWNPTQGFKGNGLTSYLHINFDISTGSKYTQNNASRGVWVTANSTTSQHNILGSHTSSREAMSNDATSSAQRINQGTTSTTAMANFGNTGLLVLNRTASNALSHFAGLTNYTRTTASISPVSDTLTVGKVNTTYGTVGTGLVFMGSNLVAEHNDLYSALSTYMGSL